MREVLKLGFVLFVVCLGAGLSLSLTFVFTQPRIEARELFEIEEALREVMPDAEGGFEKMTKDDFIYWKNISGYVIIAEGKGYGGPIRAMAGVDLSGVIKGIKILEQKETPGLGAKISKESFISQFSGQDGQKIEVSKEKGKNKIMAISGATISSVALTESVREAIERLFEIVGK